MKQYKAIFIDWDDTIGDFQHSAQSAQRDIYEQHHLSELFPSFEAYFQAYHEHNTWLWEQYGQGKVTKQFLQRDRFLWPICHSMGIPVPTIGPLVDLADRIGNDFLRLTNQYFRVLPTAVEVVRYLASKYPLTIVSNGFVEVQYYKISHSGLQDCFQHVILSEEVGIQKPQPGIYEEALRQNALSAEDVLMIGDSYASDVQGAKNAGIDQLWVCWNENDYTDSTKEATYKVRELTDICDML